MCEVEASGKPGFTTTRAQGKIPMGLTPSSTSVNIKVKAGDRTCRIHVHGTKQSADHGSVDG